MELLLVHLTDIHIEAERDFDILLDRSEAISRAIMLHITNVENTTIFLCVTGDITYSGTKEQFVYGTLFIGEIVDIIKKRYNKIMVQVVVIPGNHDCNFEDDFAPTRELLLKNIDISTATLPEIMKSYTTIQSAYFEYADSLSKEGIGFGCQNDKILTENVFNDEQNGITIRFHCINTAWCSSKHEIKGKMHFKIKDKYEKNENDIVVTLMHHDESWLDWDDAENWKDYYKTYSDIVLVGHDHTAEYVYKENYNAASNYFIKGNQLYSSGNSEQSGFNILKIDLCANIQNFFSYKWNGSIYENIIDTKGIPFNRNRFYKSGIELKKTVKDFLENMDMDLFSRYKDTLYLSDIFAYPTLRGEALTNKKSIVHYREKDTIMKAIWEKKFILILGEKEFGKTALLKKLYREFYDANKIPVWIDVSKINSADGEILNDKMKGFYNDEYDNVSAEEILQMDSENKVCIVDNFDEISLSDKSIKKVLQYLTDKFGVVILSSTPTKRMVNFLKNIEANKYIEEEFFELQICELRAYGKRQLVNKWLLLSDSEQDIDSIQFDNLRKEKLFQVESVMKNGFFHRTPLEFLLVLSYLENTTSMNVDYSRYSYIYDCLIKDKINKISDGDTNDAAMYQTILEQLAYKMYEEKQSNSVEESFLTTVIYDYNQEYTGAKGEVIDIVNRLLDYRLISRTREGYRFKYDYMLYYFACGFMEHQIAPRDRDKIIENLLSDVSKEVNYNILLFLAFGANVEYEILPKIIEASEKILPECKDFKYEQQYEMVKELEKDIETKVDDIFAVPKNKNISEIQERNAIIADMIEEQIEKDESNNVAEEMDKMTLELIQLMRLTELLGDIIKNYAGKLKRKPRMIIIDEMHKAVMKTMGKMVTSMEFIIGKIMKLIEEKQKEGDNEYLIKSDFIVELKNLFYQLWKTFVIGNVRILANRLECDRITKEILEFNDELDSEFFRMVSIEFLINTQNGNLPVKEIDSCFRGKRTLGKFSQYVMKEIIARDLCSYQFEPNSKQAVCDLLGFNIKDFRIEMQKNLNLKDA